MTVTQTLPEIIHLGGLGTDPDMDSKLIATGTTTKAEVLLMIMCHATRHNITGTQLSDLLELINCFFGKDVVPQIQTFF